MNTSKFIFRTLSAFAVALVIAVSCEEKLTQPEEDKPGETPEVEEVDPVADSIAAVLNSQIRAMQSLLLDENQKIASLRLNDNGSYSVSLIAGASFSVYPEGESYSKVFTYVEETETKYWALADAEGNAVALQDASGNKTSVEDVVTVKLVNDVLNVLVSGHSVQTEFLKETPLQAFVIEPHADAVGDIYAASFIFADGKKVVLPMVEYKDVYFTQVDATDALDSYFVSYGQTASLNLVIEDGIDYEFRITEKWSTVKGDGKTVQVTAPLQEDAVSQEALLEVIVFDDVVLAELPLSFSPFKEIFSTAVKAVVHPVGGIGDYVYGLCLESEFKEEEVLAKAKSVLSGEQEASSSCVKANSSVSVLLSELYGSGITKGEGYVLWASEGNVVMSNEFVGFGIEGEMTDVKLLDAKFKLTLTGADAIYGGTIVKSEGWLENDVLYRLNESMLDSTVVAQQPFAYEGNASEFLANEFSSLEKTPQTTYVTWVAMDAAGDYEYTADDVFFYEYTTTSVVSGGSLNVNIGEVTVGPASLSANLSCEGAAMIYYAVLSNIKGGSAAGAETNEAKFEAMCADEIHTFVGSALDAKCVTLNNGTTLKPNTSYYIYAVAIDEDGKYGNVQYVKTKTAALNYDTSITLSTSVEKVTAKAATIKVTSTGGDLSDYIYWAGTLKDPFWTLTLGGTVNNAQQYMACYPEDETIKRTMAHFGEISSDGKITLTGLTMATEYIFLIMEKGEENYSKIAVARPITLEADLGEVVYKDNPKWNQAKETIVLDWRKESFNQGRNGLLSSYGFNFSCPKDMTAYVLCAAEEHFTARNINDVDEQIIDMEEYCSRQYDQSFTPMKDGEYLTEPDYYKDGELKKGQMMNAYTYCIHGVPGLGFLTYFAEGSHGENNCTCWEDGKCSGYENALTKINRRLTLTPYLERAEMFGLTGTEATDWAQALYEAYLPYYKDQKPIIYENDGSPISMGTGSATGVNEEGLIPDRVIIVLKDLDGNYYEPMFFEVPNYFI